MNVYIIKYFTVRIIITCYFPICCSTIYMPEQRRTETPSRDFQCSIANTVHTQSPFANPM